MTGPKPGRFRVAAYNVENLFSRPSLFAPGAGEAGAKALSALGQLQRLLDAPRYRPDEILSVFNENRLYQFIRIDCERVLAPGARSQRLLFHTGESDDSPALSLNDMVRGRADWTGGIELKGEALSGPQVNALGAVIKRSDPDVLALCEVEDRRTLERFNTQILGGRYTHAVLIDGNDSRGIDVALLSKHEIIGLRTNVHLPDTGGGKGRLFERDCLEARIALPGGGELAVLITHLKSKRGSGGNEIETDRKRIRQAEAVAKIVAGRYSRNGLPSRVIVAGDFNEQPDRNGENGAALGGRNTSVDALLDGAGLTNVLRARLGPQQSFTYVQEEGGRTSVGQIDYLLLSPDLDASIAAVGVDRTGQAGWGPQAPPRSLAASDHALIFVDLDLKKLAKV